MKKNVVLFLTIILAYSFKLLSFEVHNMTETDLHYTIELNLITDHASLTSKITPGSGIKLSEFPILPTPQDAQYCKISFSGGISFVQSQVITVADFKKIVLNFKANWDGEYELMAPEHKLN